MRLDASDDELSELAEFLAMCCDQALEEGFFIAPNEYQHGPHTLCPLGATLLGDERRPAYSPHPTAEFAAQILPIPRLALHRFMRGFDTDGAIEEDRWENLGRSFRDRYFVASTRNHRVKRSAR